MARKVVVWLILALGLAGGALAAPARLPCLTAARGGARLAPDARPAFLFVTPEERRPLASGAKLILVRGEVPAPGAEALAAVVEDGYRRIVSEIGFGGFPDRVSVSFADLDGAEGYVSLGGRGTSAEIVLSRSLSGPALVHALAHQVGHLAASAYGREPTRWWSEASASWIEAKLAPDSDASSAGLRSSLSEPGRSIVVGASASAWLSFLESRFGAETIRRIWEEAAAKPGDSVLVAIETVLSGLGTSLRSEMNSYAAWVVAEVRRRSLADGAAASPDSWQLPLAADASRFPVEGQVTSDGPEPLGVTFLRFGLSEVAGGIHLRIQSDTDGDWTASAVVVPAGVVLPSERVAFGGRGGRAELSLPVSDLGEVLVAVCNLGGSGRLGFSYQVRSDDTFPYVLRRLDATAEPSGIRLFWDTASESDVLGWSVLRSSDPREAFAPLNHVLVPAASLLGAEAGLEYTWLDGDVEAGRTYYYYVEALTSQGLTGSSHIVSITAR